MIEIRELIIRTNVTQNATGASQAPKASGATNDSNALEQLLKGLHEKNER